MEQSLEPEDSVGQIGNKTRKSRGSGGHVADVCVERAWA